MNICYLIDVHPSRFNGGGQVHLLNLVQEMQSQIPASPARLAVKRAGGSNLKSQIYGANNAGFLSRIIWMIIVIPRVLFHHFFLRRFDLIHAHSIPAMIPAKVLSFLLGVPVVVTVHGHTMRLDQISKIKYSFGPSSGRGQKSKIQSYIEKILLTRIRYDTQITVSRDFLQYPNVNKHIVYVPNGVDLVRFSSHQSPITNHRSPVILFVGRKNDPIKGFSVLEKAMMLVRKQFPSVRLIAADGTIPSFQLLDIYRSADLLVIPSLSEGFPLTLLEAWASKLPVVATTVGEIPYLVKDGINGFLVLPRDPRKLANGILRALKHKNLARLGENGYNLAKCYSWKKVATKTLKLYQHILNYVPVTNH